MSADAVVLYARTNAEVTALVPPSQIRHGWYKSDIARPQVTAFAVSDVPITGDRADAGGDTRVQVTVTADSLAEANAIAAALRDLFAEPFTVGGIDYDADVLLRLEQPGDTLQAVVLQFSVVS